MLTQERHATGRKRKHKLKPRQRIRRPRVARPLVYTDDGEPALQLPDGSLAVISPEKVWLAAWNWWWTGGNGPNRYVGRSVRRADGRTINVMLHSVIVGLQDPVTGELLERAVHEQLTADHLDGDRLNNRTHNLRVATKKEQRENRRATLGRQFIGVHRSGAGWIVKVVIGGEATGAGRTFRTAAEAAEARDRLAVQHHGRPRLNFPDRRAEYEAA